MMNKCHMLYVMCDAKRTRQAAVHSYGKTVQAMRVLACILQHRVCLTLYSILFATPKPIRAITLICARKAAHISSCAPQLTKSADQVNGVNSIADVRKSGRSAPAAAAGRHPAPFRNRPPPSRCCCPTPAPAPAAARGCGCGCRPRACPSSCRISRLHSGHTR